MEKRININEAKAHLSEVIRLVQKIRELSAILKNKQPVVDIVVLPDLSQSESGLG